MLQQSLRGGMRINATVAKASPALLRCILQRRPPSPRELRQLFETLGVTYIKLGQFIASSPSFFPPAYIEEFQHCLDRTPNLPYKTIRKIIASELDGRLSTTFRSINPVPLASASIAQVHAATLCDGTEVVIKVQKPAVADIINTDLNTAFFVARLLELVSPALGKSAITDIIEELHQSMIDECDFVKEANNLREFNRFVKQHGIAGVFAPRPIAAASTTHILTMERVYGRAITDPALQQPAQRERVQSALFAALQTWFLSISSCSFFHADLHSGNMLLQEDGRVAFIDFGMVGTLNDRVWRGVLELYTGISTANIEQVAAAMIDIGMTRHKVYQPELVNDLKAVMALVDDAASDAPGCAPDNAPNNAGSDAPDSGNEAIEQYAQQQLSALMRVATRHGIRFPSAFTLLLKQLLYFDRYLDLLAPGTQLFDAEVVGGGLFEQSAAGNINALENFIESTLTATGSSAEIA
ncbi:MAG: AarF/ABC1/UbiB kinase family protein [Pseudomonadales bacterium]|nr:AarF/ABC1/UbiB kinase family protein [Pseudomonadales bacterium]